MRWFVEISSLGNKPSPITTLCVEATQWQPALQKARALRGDEGALSNFSIELMEDGFRAIDPMARLRYVVKRAPDDAALSNGTPPAPKVEASEPAPAVELPKKRPTAQTMPFTSLGAAAVISEKAPEIPAEEPAPSLPEFDLLSKREENPSDRSPLIYRELVYAVAHGTPEDDARRLILDRFEHVRGSLDQGRSGKLINLAIFDHKFQSKPLRRPLVTLTWKDWKSGAPEIAFPLRSGPSSPPSGPVTFPPVTPRPETVPAQAAEPPAAPKPSSTPAPATPEAPTKTAAAAERKSAPAPASAPEAAPAASKAPSTPPQSPQVKKPAKPQKRLSGEDLITELFESFGDLHFLRDSLEGAEFVLALMLEKLPSEVGLVSLFDINKREFVVVRQVGGPRSALCKRQPERAALASTAMRKRRAVVIADAEGAAKAKDDRWEAIGVEPRTLICAPVEHGGRYLGLIELANPLDGGAFNEGDGNALTYIGGQFAEFVATHGVIIDPEIIQKSPEPVPPPKKSRS